jgi:hypothetical protein
MRINFEFIRLCHHLGYHIWIRRVLLPWCACFKLASFYYIHFLIYAMDNCHDNQAQHLECISKNRCSVPALFPLSMINTITIPTNHLHKYIFFVTFLSPFLSGSLKSSSNDVVVDHTVIRVRHKKEKNVNFLFSRKQTKRMVEEGCRRLQTRKGSIHQMFINQKST